MIGFLNREQINYILFHLGHHIRLDDSISQYFVFVKSPGEITNHSQKIIFLLSEKDINIDRVIYSEKIPILFPVDKVQTPYSLENGNLIINHDLLKSAFYLLSGEQEYKSGAKDSMGRYSYEDSIQYKLNVTQIPVVNYYFDFIIHGISEFCALHNIEISRTSFSNNFIFSLSHDVDRVKYYSLNILLFKSKQLLGLAKRDRKKSLLINEIFSILVNTLNIFNRKDPYWNFDFLNRTEKKLDIHSTYYFLPKDQKHIDSYYRLGSRKIKSLIINLRSEGHEIGLHSTVRSSTSLDALKKNYNELFNVTQQSLMGIRQHRLMWQHPLTAINHENAGLAYDSTLLFAAHEGFRNSYCHLFKLWDFENNRMLSHWEIPLEVMDATIFYYRKLGFVEAWNSIESIINEVKRFNGIFTLLWHNHYFDENELPGIKNFYLELLTKVSTLEPEAFTGLEIVKRFEGNG